MKKLFAALLFVLFASTACFASSGSYTFDSLTIVNAPSAVDQALSEGQPIGAVSPSTGAFTTLSTSGNATIGAALSAASMSISGNATITGSLTAASLSISGNSLQWGTASPTTGSWIQGAIMFNSAPVAAGTIGWVCVTSGSPGTWKAFGPIVN